MVSSENGQKLLCLNFRTPNENFYFLFLFLINIFLFGRFCIFFVCLWKTVTFGGWDLWLLRLKLKYSISKTKNINHVSFLCRKNYFWQFYFMVDRKSHSQVSFAFGTCLQIYPRRIRYNMTLLTSSRLNKTPPMGAPNATDTPAAAAADRTFRKILLVFAFTVYIYDINLCTKL